MIRIVRYDPTWPTVFEAEAAHIRSVMGDVALRIEHVGSTSVPGLPAKAVIDIQISVADVTPVSRYVPILERLGYKHLPLGDFDLVYSYFHKPPQWPTTHHIHLCAAGGEQEARHLAFRNFLRAHPDVAGEYVRLKRSLAAEHQGGTLESGEQYSLGKSSFVEAVLERAKADGWWP